MGEKLVREVQTLINRKVLKIYPYGSRVYGTAQPDSDYDYYVVVEDDGKKKDDNGYFENFYHENIQLIILTESQFIEQIKEHHISILECIFQDKNDEYQKYFEYNSEKLRKSVSSVASNSFVKCRKKLEIGEDYIGRKSMWHSLRILLFGMQIATFGKIISYTMANEYYDDIVLTEHDWDYLKETYQPVYNRYKSQFKVLAPTEKDDKRKWKNGLQT